MNSIYAGQTQQQQYNTALATLSPSERATYTATNPTTTNPYQGNTYTPPVNTGGTSIPSTTVTPAKTTTPVVTSNAAQDDYNKKYAAYQQQIASLESQTQRIGQQAADAANAKSQSDLQKAQLKLQQQGMDMKKAEIDAKNYALGLTSGQNTNPVNNTQATAPTTGLGSTPTGDTSALQGTTAPQGGTPVGTGSTPANNIQVANDQNTQAQNQILDAKTSAITQFQSQVAQIMNGTFPLSADQNALINSVQQSLERQKQSIAGTMSMEAARGGQEYTPGQTASNIAARVMNLDARAAGTMANLRMGFMKQDYDMINSAYEKQTKFLDDKAQEIQKLHDTVVATETANRNYQMDVAKFNQTADQNAFDRAFKVEQEDFQQKKDALTLAHEGATLAETVRHNMATESNSLPGGGNTGIVSSATMSSMGGVDKQSQEQVLAEITQKYGPLTATAIKGLTDYSRLPTDFSVRPLKGTGGMSRADAVSLAQQLDPTYTEAGAPARQAYMKSLASGTIYNATIAANKAINHLATFSSDVSALGNQSPVSTINKLNQNIQRLYRPDIQQKLSESQMVSSGLGEEMAKFFKGTGTSDVESIKTFTDKLDPYASPSNLKGTVQGALDLFSGQIDVMNQAYTNTMGKAPDGSLLQPATIQKLSELKNQGYRVDIPGVGYTDPIAYQKSPEFDKAMWDEARKAFPNYTPQQILQIVQ